jgi:hypothetical protein
MFTGILEAWLLPRRASTAESSQLWRCSTTGRCRSPSSTDASARLRFASG